MIAISRKFVSRKEAGAMFPMNLTEGTVTMGKIPKEGFSYVGKSQDYYHEPKNFYVGEPMKTLAEIESKSRRFMGFFRKKEKMRETDGLFSHEITEKEYVDKEFELLKKAVQRLKNEITLLKELVTADYLLIQPVRDTYIFEEWRLPEDSRKMAKEKGYTYVKPFEELGELWTKEVKQ